MALAARVPVVIASEHNVYTAKERRHIMIERWLARRTTALVAVSAQVQLYLAGQLNVDPSRIHIVRNGITPQAPSPQGVAALRRQLQLPEGPVIGAVASLTPKKGHAFLFQALAALPDRGQRWSLVLAGDGSERAALEALAAQLGIADRVRFLGVCPQVADLLSLVDVFVLSSLSEGLPLALLEAMAAGKAVVATDVGGVPEVIAAGENGLLVPPREVQPLADAIHRLLRDAELRAQYGERAKATVLEHFTGNQHLASLSALYLTLMHRPARGVA